MDHQLISYLLKGPLDSEDFLDADQAFSSPEMERQLLVEQGLIERWSRTISGGMLFGGPSRSLALEMIRSIAADHEPVTIAAGFHEMALGRFGPFNLADDLAVWQLLRHACAVSAGTLAATEAGLPQ